MCFGWSYCDPAATSSTLAKHGDRIDSCCTPGGKPACQCSDDGEQGCRSDQCRWIVWLEAVQEHCDVSRATGTTYRPGIGRSQNDGRFSDGTSTHAGVCVLGVFRRLSPPSK